MSNNILKQAVFHRLAEQGIPTDYDPWEAVKRRLDANLNLRTSGQVHKFNPFVKIKMNVRLTGTLTLLFIIVGMVLILTPQGRVAAQGLLNLFRRAESNVLPVPSEYREQPQQLSPTKTPAPTRIIGVDSTTTDERGIFFTPTPAETNMHGTITYGLTLSEAQNLVKFPIRTLSSLPDGYQLAQLSYDSQSETVQQVYEFSPYQAGEAFVLSQGLSQPAESIGLKAEIEQIQVGEMLVETVKGSWFSSSGADYQEWISDAPVETFRWQQDGFYFSLTFMLGDTFSPAYLREEDIQAVVELATGARSTFPERVNLNNLASIEEAQAAAGFTLLAPTVLPEGFALQRAVYEPENQRAIFIYRLQDSSGDWSGPSLVIYEMKRNEETVRPAPDPSLLPEAVEPVTIGTVTGMFQRGAMVDGEYDPDERVMLYWATNDLCVNIVFTNSQNYPDRLGADEMTEIAKGLQ